MQSFFQYLFWRSGLWIAASFMACRESIIEWLHQFNHESAGFTLKEWFLLFISLPQCINPCSVFANLEKRATASAHWYQTGFTWDISNWNCKHGSSSYYEWLQIFWDQNYEAIPFSIYVLSPIAWYSDPRQALHVAMSIELSNRRLHL